MSESGRASYTRGAVVMPRAHASCTRTSSERSDRISSVALTLVTRPATPRPGEGITLLFVVRLFGTAPLSSFLRQLCRSAPDLDGLLYRRALDGPLYARVVALAPRMIELRVNPSVQ